MACFNINNMLVSRWVSIASLSEYVCLTDASITECAIFTPYGGASTKQVCIINVVAAWGIEQSLPQNKNASKLMHFQAMLCGLSRQDVLAVFLQSR